MKQSLVVDAVVGQIGKGNIKAFWLVGHSRTDFFKDKVDGWLSLSGGRLAASVRPPR